MTKDSHTDDIPAQIATLRGELAEWIREAGLLVELARNAERTGVPGDPRTLSRTRDLSGKVRERCEQVKLWQSQTGSLPMASELRILKATLEAIEAEAAIAMRSFRTE